MKIKNYFYALLFPIFTFSQVGIGTTTPDASAVLDVTSTNKGMLIPRVALVNVTNTTTPISSPIKGLMVWNTNTTVTGGAGEGFYYFNGTVWVPVNVNTSNTLDQAYDYGGPGAGRTIIADSNPVHIGGEDGLIVTGTFGLGNTLNPALGSTYNARMFFYPKKAAFRAGYDSFSDADPAVDNEGAWDTDAEIGNYSFATGRYNRASGEGSFAANNDNHASGQYATAFGSDTQSSGLASFSTGFNTIASGNYSFVTGSSSSAIGENSFASGSNVIANSFSESVLGSFNKTIYNDAHVANPTAFQATDRAFSVGIGSGSGNRKNGFEVYKNGIVRINDTYNLPTVDGTANQVIATDGAGNLSWVTPQNNKNIIPSALYAENTSLNFTYGALSDVPEVKTSVLPGIIAPINGDIQLKLQVLCTTTNVPTAFRLIANDGTSDTTITLLNPTTTTVSGNVIYTCDWTNWNADETKTYSIRLQAQGTNIDLGNAHILFRAQ